MSDSVFHVSVSFLAEMVRALTPEQRLDFITRLARGVTPEEMDEFYKNTPRTTDHLLALANGSFEAWWRKTWEGFLVPQVQARDLVIKKRRDRKVDTETLIRGKLIESYARDHPSRCSHKAVARDLNLTLKQVRTARARWAEFLENGGTAEDIPCAAEDLS